MRLLVLMLALVLLPGSAYAQQETEEALSAQSLQAEIDGVLDGLDFSGLEQLELPGFAGQTSIEALVRALASGETFSAEDCVAWVLGSFFDALAGLGQLMLSIMLPVLLASLLMHMISPGMSALFSLAKNVCFVLILIPVLLLVFSELEHARETITAMTRRMDKLLPMLLTLLTALGGSASSAFLHPMVVAASGSMVFLAREVTLRLVMCTCAVTAVNHLSDRAHLTRMVQLLRSSVCWLLGVSFTVFLGAMSLQGVCSASIDGVVLRAAKYAVDNFVPVGAVLGPLMRTLAVVLVMKLSAALLEPVADGDIVRAIGDFSRTIVLFLITMLCVGTMYFLLIVQMLLVGNLTVLLR